MSSYFQKVEKYYEQQKNSMASKLESHDKKKIKYKFYSSGKQQIVEVLVDGKTVMKAEYDILGVYNFQNSVWSWAYSTAFVNRLASKNSKKVTEIAKEVMDKYTDFDSYEDAEELFFYTNSPNFFCHQETVPKLVKIGLHSLRGQWIVSIRHGNNGANYIEYIVIQKELSL